MPNWNFPVSMPKFDDSTFLQEKEAYVAEHGFYVDAPGLGEIIHLGFKDEPDDQEWADFRSSQLRHDNPYRQAEIVDLLNEKRARRDRMLASPIPQKVKYITSIMTVLDDINDSLGTAGVLMRVAAKIAPRALGKLMLGPIGWLFLLADVAGLFLQVTRLPLACFSKKRVYERARGMNPFSKKARVLRARKTRRLKPSKGELIELLQTTDNIFGIGLCLGPIMGFGYDVLSGIVRTVAGQEVHWGRPPPSRPEYTRAPSRLLRNAPALHAVSEELTEEDHLRFMIALNGATQMLKPYIDEWHPLDQVDNFNNVLFEAPRPIHPTTRYVLEEVGIREGERIGWPGLDKDLAGWEELWDHTQPIAAEGFMDFAVRNRNSYVGSVGCLNGDEYGMNMLLMTEGYDTVEYISNDEWKGYADYFATGCKLIDCGSFAGGGWGPLFEKWKATRFGDRYLFVKGSSLGLPGVKGIRAGGWLPCKNCYMYIGTEMAPVGFQRMVIACAVGDETDWLRWTRLRILKD